MAVSSDQDSRGYGKPRAITGYFGLSQSWVRRKVKSGELPSYKLPSGTILIAYADVDQWLARFRVEGGRDCIDELVEQVMDDI